MNEKRVKAVVLATDSEGNPLGNSVEVYDHAILEGGNKVTVRDAEGETRQIDEIVVRRYPPKGKPEEIPLTGVYGWGRHPPAIVEVKEGEVIVKVPYGSGYEKLAIKEGNCVRLLTGIREIAKGENGVPIIDRNSEDVQIRIYAKRLE